MHPEFRSPPVVLSIAGSDPSGGAGLQADLKTFSAWGVYGMALPTAITVQSTRGVVEAHPLPPALIGAQLRTLLADLRPDVIKIGMVGGPAQAEVVLQELKDYSGSIVLDPVLRASLGGALFGPAAPHPNQSEAAAADHNPFSSLLALASRCTLLTPNLPEAHQLFGERSLTTWVADTGVAVLLKGGHGAGDELVDQLMLPGEAPRLFRHPRLFTRNVHGTGCTLAAATAAGLARGWPLPIAVGEAIDWLQACLAASQFHQLGGGTGPLLHHFQTTGGRGVG